MNMNYYIENKKVPEDMFFRFVLSNSNIQRLFEKKMEAINEFNIVIDEDITSQCVLNLKKAK